MIDMTETLRNPVPTPNTSLNTNAKPKYHASLFKNSSTEKNAMDVIHRIYESIRDFLCPYLWITAGMNGPAII